MPKVLPEVIEFSIPFADGSGVKAAVRYRRHLDDAQYITVEHAGEVVTFPSEDLQWIRECLNKVSNVVHDYNSLTEEEK